MWYVGQLPHKAPAAIVCNKDYEYFCIFHRGLWYFIHKTHNPLHRGSQWSLHFMKAFSALQTAASSRFWCFQGDMRKVLPILLIVRGRKWTRWRPKSHIQSRTSAERSCSSIAPHPPSFGPPPPRQVSMETGSVWGWSLDSTALGMSGLWKRPGTVLPAAHGVTEATAARESLASKLHWSQAARGTMLVHVHRTSVQQMDICMDLSKLLLWPSLPLVELLCSLHFTVGRPVTLQTFGTGPS